jgi:peptidyl-Lys metalloendopeptidase
MFQTNSLEENVMNKGKVRFNSLLFVLLIALLVTSIASAAPKDGPTVKLSVAQGEFDSGQDVLVTVNLSNTTKHTVKILKWYTAVDGVEESLFAVTRNGEPVAYTGPIYKRPLATGNDYLSLKSGESITRVVNLGEYYDLSAPGQYEVFYAVASFNMFNEKGNAFKLKDVLTSEKISFNAKGSNGKGKPTPPPPPAPGGNSFNACSADQQTLLAAARNTAKTYAANSENYLLAGNQGSRYTTWFGAITPTRYNTVKNNFIAISNAMDNAGITFDCKCKQPYYAYVYSNDPYKIYLCKVFWQAPPAGTDSQAGTLIHEMSHFDIVAGTDDFAYGKAAAMQLATNNPNDAIKNADSHEYFAENSNPALP